MTQEVQEETSLWECQANVIDDKNCQDNLWPVMSIKIFNNLWSVEQATQSSYKRSLCHDKNHQSTRCYKKKYPVRSKCDDRNCQSNVCSDKNCQTHMQLVTKSSYMWLTKLAIIQSRYK